MDNSKYLSEVGKEHQEKFGQFFTHPKVAKFMVEWTLGSGMKSVYDPAVGLGAFNDPLIGRNDIQFVGSEVDAQVLSFLLNSHSELKATVRHEDYLLSWGKTRENIVCNPPYARFQKFNDRNTVFKLFEENLNINLSGYTNIASAFLLKSISELVPGGRLAYIMPLEFLNTGYGEIVKHHLIKHNWLRSIIKFDCEKEVFPDVTTTVGIILVDTVGSHSHIDFHSVVSVNELDIVLESEPCRSISVDNIDPHSKWMSYFDRDPIEVKSENLIPLSHYGRFSRGIATGANEFFTLNLSEVEKLDITKDVIPCITKSAQIKTPLFNDYDYDELLASDAKVLLFSPGENCSDSAQSYVLEGEFNKYNERYLTKNRSPWYKTEHRNPAPILMSVFSRNGHRIVRNLSRATNLTCYHGFYPNNDFEDYVDLLFLYMLSASGKRVMSLSKRVYGESLDKFEPNDLNKSLIPYPRYFDSFNGSDIEQAMKYVMDCGCVPDWFDAEIGKVVM